MAYPLFFDTTPSIVMYDPLSQALGVSGDGRFEYTYLDAVKLAGHSCPTVAGAWLCTQLALERLYEDKLPVRGQIRIEMRDAIDSGTIGVIASVVTLVTGASGAGGFKGLNGNFSRHNQLLYERDIPTQMRFTRLDTQEAVDIDYDPSPISPDARVPELMKKILTQQAAQEDIELFGRLWQERVFKILSSAKEVCKITKIG